MEILCSGVSFLIGIVIIPTTVVFAAVHVLGVAAESVVFIILLKKSLLPVVRWNDQLEANSRLHQA